MFLRVRQVAAGAMVYNAVVDDGPVPVPAVTDQQPLDTVALHVHAKHQRQRLGRDDTALETVVLGAIAEHFPVDRLVVRLEGEPEPIIPERLLGAGTLFPVLRTTGLDRQPLARQVLPALERRIGHPDAEGPMAAAALRILGDPLRAVFRLHHPFAMVLVDLAAASDADEMRLFGMLGINVVPHVLPAQLLQLVAVRTGDVVGLLRPFLIVRRDLAARRNHRR